MARTDTLPHFLTDVADAIRNKKGTSETINTSNFDTEIESIPSGDVDDYFYTEVYYQTPSVTAPTGIKFIKECPDLTISNNTTTLINAFNGMMFAEKLPKVICTNSITSMENMFQGCSKVVTLDLTGLVTSNVTTMKKMFNGMSSMHSITFPSNFDTGKVTNMDNMFTNCMYVYSWGSSYQTPLYDLDVSVFDTKNVTTMQGMFQCMNLCKSINVSGWTNEKVTNMSYMFSNGGAIDTPTGTMAEINFTNFKTPAVTNMSYMFYKYLGKSLDLSSFNFDNVTSIANMFCSCLFLEEIDLSTFTCGKITNFSNIFSDCSKLKTLSLPSIDTTKTTNLSSMFRNCKALTSLSLPSTFNTQLVTALSGMFIGCESITNLDLSTFTAEKVKNTDQMFQNCYKLEELDLSNFDLTTNITSFSSMFQNCGTQTTSGLTMVYVKDTDSQNWVLTKANGRPSTWSTANVIVAGSSDDLRNV